MAALHGDPDMARIMGVLLKGLEVGAAVETGTFMGDTTRWLAERCDRVWTCEIREDFYRKRQAYAGPHDDRVAWLLGPSQECLPGMIAAALAATDQRVLVMLDAHWQDDWPLKCELEVCWLAEQLNPGRLVILVDDFEVPGCPWFSAPRGGGGCVGDPLYGPRTKLDPTLANLDTFGGALGRWESWVFPTYPGQWAGWMVASGLPWATVSWALFGVPGCSVWRNGENLT